MQRWSLPCPVVPARLWGTAAAGTVAIASLVFDQEIWPHHPQARQWSWLALALLLQAGALQVIVVLWAWPTAFSGPGWMRLLLRAVVLAAIMGIAVMQMWALCISFLVLASS
ncbi:hypothetical protein [Hymenobacter daeguensis]